MNTLTDELRLELKEFLQHHSEIVAAWEGGSAATGYLDQYSDLDLSIVINKGNPDNIFSILDEFLESRYGIIKRFRMPEPTWHGMSQCFYQ
ncbi:MAG: nucleotidyltransferase domain-containing protein [Candidatus Cloacimonetes bacterium]|nr:nucleotidyltransferase domain-containing protein [Candidatus Cloacimonadota bacterium]